MENQPIVENQPGLALPETKKSHTFLAVIISVIVTAAIAGGGIYYWQNKLLNEVEETTSEGTPVQTTIIKPIVTSPQSGTTIENVSDGVKIVGKAAPNSFVWLFSVSEMDPDCLNLGLSLTLGDRVDANGNFEIDYAPSDEASWPSEFAVVSLDETQKYQLKWLESMFCAPDEAKSDAFQLTFKPTTTNILLQDDTYHFRIIGTAKSCTDYYSARMIEQPDYAKKIYGIFASGSKSWPQEQPAFTYAIYTQKVYDSSVKELFLGYMKIDLPQIVLHLDNGDLLTQWPSRDIPADMPKDCEFNFEKF